MFEYIIDKELVFKGTKKRFTKSPQRIVLHHSGASADQTVEQIHNYHINHNGWLGIGYNALVDKNGNVFWSRGIEYVGAHCKGYNETSVGICAIGNMETGQMPEKQKTSIIKLVQDIKTFYPSITTVCGHKELAATDCPGKNYPLEEIKNSKAQAIVKETKQTLKFGSRGNEVKTLQQMLISHGVNPGKVDGIFGKNTEKAVKEFQTKEGIVVDGIVGKISWGRLGA